MEPLKNTFENKEIFMYQYFGVPVFKLEMLDKLYSRPVDRILANDYLELRSLYSIKDEELKELIEIITGSSKIIIDSKSHEWVRSLVTHIPKDTLNGWKGIFTLNYKDATFFITNSVKQDLLAGYDYLKSKGFALPYKGVPVQTLVDWGWIKLID